MIKEEKIEFTAKWCKYSKYKIAERDDKLYVLPDEKSEPSTYNPFECGNEMLKDMLVIGKEVWENQTYKLAREVRYEILSKSKEYQELVVDFANKYGLLGNFRYLPENHDFMDKKDLPVILGYNKFTTRNEFEYKYFGFDKKVDWSKGTDVLDYARFTGLDDYLRQVEGDRLNDPIFTKYYSETVAEILEFAAHIYDQKRIILAYLYEDTTDDIREMYGNAIACVNINKAMFGYAVKDGEIKFEWKFDSLRAMIDTMLLLNETNGRTEVKLCKHCASPFVAKNIKAEYDTPQCRNKANIYRSRNKNK